MISIDVTSDGKNHREKRTLLSTKSRFKRREKS